MTVLLVRMFIGDRAYCMLIQICLLRGTVEVCG